MKVLILNGSPRHNGNTTIACNELAKTFAEEGIETETVQVGIMNLRGCIACGRCKDTGTCILRDDLNDITAKFKEADGLIVASPVYFASANATLVACLDRMFYSGTFDKSMKVGAAVVVARRGGTSATFDELNKYFTISGMPVASGYYWNSVYGAAQGEAEQDAEGLRNMRNLAHNMAFLMKSIALGKETYGMPARESGPMTNFIR